MKKTVLFLMALIMSASFAFAATTIPASSSVPGVKVLDLANNGDGYTGANIFTGTDFNVWPWTSGPVAAFTPVKGGAYTLTFNFTATKAINGIRVRWITNDSYGANQGTPLVVGMFGEGAEGPGRFTTNSVADGTVAGGLSAYFNGALVAGDVRTFTVNFTMDDVAAFNNIGSIGIRGAQGSNDFVVNTIVITDADGNQLVNYNKDAGTGIIQVKPMISNVWNTNGGIIVNAVNQNVSIFAIDGRLVKQVVAGHDTNISLPQGLYIVKVGAAKAVKVVVK